MILPALQRAWPDIRQDADAAIRHGFASGRLLSADAEKVERELRMANEAIRSGAGMGAVSWELV
ncbi:hypothetical protein, partial [Pseudomonas syringae]|uniref:hypothetical protein n=1 Tax=Pseudomonas syringae TaxID=317 RepID=UPI0034D65893